MHPGLHRVLTAEWESGHAEPCMECAELRFSILDDQIALWTSDEPGEQCMALTDEGADWLRHQVRRFLGLDPATDLCVG